MCSIRLAAPAPRLCRRAMGPPVDHDRHLARCARAGPCPHHGCALSVLPAGRFAGRANQRSAEITAATPPRRNRHNGNIRHGFVYERVPHITLKSIANNAEIDVIWEKWQEKLEPLREKLNAGAQEEVGGMGDSPRGGRRLAGRSQEAACRVVGGPHRPAEGNRRLDRRQGRLRIPLRQALRGQEEGPRRRAVHGRKPLAAPRARRRRERRTDRPACRRRGDGRRSSRFAQMILENLKTAGVQQAHKEDKIDFHVAHRPGRASWSAPKAATWKATSRAASGRSSSAPSSAPSSAQTWSLAAREAGDAGFDVLIACAFNYEAHATEFNKLGRIPVLKARMNADLHMADDLKNTGKGNLFVIFGEPDIDILPREGRPDPGEGQRRRRLPPQHRRSPQRRRRRHRLLVHRHRLQRRELLRPPRLLPRRRTIPTSASRPRSKPRSTKKPGNRSTATPRRPFDKPKSGRIAVKVINHLGDEVMKVFRI